MCNIWYSHYKKSVSIFKGWRRMKIAVIGGSQEQTFKEIASRYGLEVLFHCGKTEKAGKTRDFRNIVKKSDICVILLGACSHGGMNEVKRYCKKYQKPLLFHNGFGATGAIKKCVDYMKQAA